jgi:predicted CXXCH cytochrome family protein
VDPAERLPYATVSENACASCHKIHSARARERLLRFQREEDNCLNCHNGGLARKNISGEVRKRSAHRVERYTGRHDPAELARTAPRHVECVDCHNPHATRSQVVRTVNRPDLGLVGGTLRKVNGINRFGRPIPESRFEYEVCFKCHAENAGRNGDAYIIRQITSLNTRLDMQPGNPSYHPVIAPRNNPEVVSLRPPWRVGARMRCTHCHNSDTALLPGGQGVYGPHGSIYEPLLIANYDTAEFVTESARAYALCYQCHDRGSILNDESFPFHSRHIVGARSSCSACHDAHGISRTRGSSRNHSNLINFDLNVVRPASGTTFRGIEFVDLGRLSGSCTLVCHGFTHVNTTYGLAGGGLP